MTITELKLNLSDQAPTISPGQHQKGRDVQYNTTKHL